MKTTEKIFEIYNVEKDFDAMTCRVTKDSPKSRYGIPKSVWAYKFRDIDHMNRYFNEWVNRMTTIIKDKENRKKAKSDAKKNMVNPFFVGQIFYDSWGYDQTNIDFYQIVEIGKKSVTIRPIAPKMVNDAGFMAEYVAPIADNFTGGPIKKIIQVYIDSQGKPQYNISSRHGWISPWGDREKIYQSHYA